MALLSGITRRGESYRFTVSIGLDGFGKQVRKYTTFKPPQGTSPSKSDKLANEAYMEFSNKCKGMKTLQESMRFHELAEKYFSEFAPNELKGVTVYNYRLSTDKHILPVFGNRKLKDISTADITGFLLGLEIRGQTTRKIKTILQSIFSYAVEQGYIKENPCIGARYKKDKDFKERKYLTKEEAKIFMTVTEPYAVEHVALRLLLYTGMRSGECLGLRWEDIDLNEGLISVKNTLSYADGKWYLDAPKTKTSRRVIKIDTPALEMLRHHKEKQDEGKRIVGDAWAHPEMVFTSCTGRYYDRNLLNKQFHRILRDNHLPLIPVHGLRHTNASILIFNGVGLKNVSEHLGHCNVQITGDVYAHMFEEYKNKIADVLSLALDA